MEFRPNIGSLTPDLRELLAPGDVLRAGINVSNFLLVSRHSDQAEPEGVAPDLARALANHLEVRVRLMSYANPGLLADAAVRDEWDVGLIGAEPQRAQTIAFTPAYCEIEAAYLVPAASKIRTIADIDAEGVRIAVNHHAAYGLWLERNVRKAELIRSATLDESARDFVEGGLEALSGLRPRLLQDAAAIPGARILDGYFMTVQQAIGVPKAKSEVAEYLAKFVAAAKESGFVAKLIDKFAVQGLSVAR